MGIETYSTTAANNNSASPAGWPEGMLPSGVNDSDRAFAAAVRAEWAQGSNLASAATVNIGASVGAYIHITGTVTITAFDTIAAGIRRFLIFDGALTLTHNATTLILPGAANIKTAAGDCAIFMSEGSGNWRCLAYMGKGGTAEIGNAANAAIASFYDSSGGTSYQTLEIASNRADSNGGTYGVLEFSANSQSAGHKAMATIVLVSQGTTANQRGGQLQFFTKKDGSTTLNQVGSFDKDGVLTAIGQGAEGSLVFSLADTAAARMQFFNVRGTGGNAAATGINIPAHTVTGRSINSGGTNNASGADYAEYERKSSLDVTFLKGDVVGFGADGRLVTLNNAISYGVKSTNPSFVGGDSWGSDISDSSVLKAERTWVDRVSYSGKTPVNVLGSKPGDVIVSDNGGEPWDLIADPNVPDWFKRYLRSVGRVRRILPDGRAEIAVYVH